MPDKLSRVVRCNHGLSYCLSLSLRSRSPQVTDGMELLFIAGDVVTFPAAEHSPPFAASTKLSYMLLGDRGTSM